MRKANIKQANIKEVESTRGMSLIHGENLKGEEYDPKNIAKNVVDFYLLDILKKNTGQNNPLSFSQLSAKLECTEACNEYDSRTLRRKIDALVKITSEENIPDSVKHEIIGVIGGSFVKFNVNEKTSNYYFSKCEK